MRSYRRPLAFAATCIPVLLGVSVVVGAQPAAAATTDCGATATRPDGQLDARLLQSCLLDQVQSSYTGAAEPVAEPEPEPEATPVVEAPVFNALDAVFSPEVEVLTLGGPVEAPAEPPAEEAASLGGTFAALRDCESGGDYGINTGNGYYGAYQFSLETWQGLGYGGYPHEASPAIQDQAAAELQSLYGWGQWPGCSWYLGL